MIVLSIAASAVAEASCICWQQTKFNQSKFEIEQSLFQFVHNQGDSLEEDLGQRGQTRHCGQKIRSANKFDFNNWEFLKEK